MPSVFHFKEFSVDQTGCAMKINTDGVLAGALSENEDPRFILDIGTGTGVIALMLAQRFAGAKIDAVEIDQQAAEVAETNFLNSSFAHRLHCYSSSFEDFFLASTIKYDLIVSNPPFFIGSLQNPDKRKSMARHTSHDFFNNLLTCCSGHLSEDGLMWLILPVPLAKKVIKLAEEHQLYLQRQVNICSFKTGQAHRYLFSLSRKQAEVSVSDFIIYKAEKQYSDQYRQVLKSFLTIF